MLKRGRIFWVGALLVLVLFQYSILKKERILAEGHMLLLELAPVDPRSLMQGDYMVLDYAIQRELWGKEKKDRHIVVRAAEDRVATYVGIYDKNTPLEQDEYLIRCYEDSYRDEIRPKSFFFQEGHAEFYDNARYGIFRCADDGECLLTGLADADRREIRPAVQDTE